MDYSPLPSQPNHGLESSVTENDAKRAVDQVVRALAAARERRGLSKKSVAALAGVDPKTITLVESGQRSPTLYTVLRICAALECDLRNLLAGSSAAVDHPPLSD